MGYRRISIKVKRQTSVGSVGTRLVTVTVSGMGGQVSTVTVKLVGLTHTCVADVAAVLVSPEGRAVAPGDQIQVFTEGTYATYRRTASRWLPAEPVISLGEGFFIEMRRTASWPSNVAE
jgi:hypothetical protein